MKYEYTQNATAEIPIILVDKYIGKDEKGVTGIDGGQFAREVLALKNEGKKAIEVWINSPGGNVSDGFNIYGSLKNCGMHVTTINMGAVDSTASWIYQAGDKRVWMNYGLGFIHNVGGASAGQQADAANLSIATMLASKSTKTVDDFLSLMSSDTLMTTDIARDYGFYDELRNSSKIKNFTNVSDAYKGGNEEIKKSLPKTTKMEALNGILGLTNEASEDARIVAVNKIIEAKNLAETEVTNLTTKLTNTTELLTSVQGQLTEATARENEAIEAKKLADATTLVNSYVGKAIKNDPNAIAKWVNFAKADYEMAKSMLDEVPVNIKAPQTPEATTAPVGGQWNMAVQMANIKSNKKN